MKNQAVKWLSVLCALALLISFVPLLAQMAPAEPSQEALGKLQIVIEGPDPRMPMTILYKDFVNGEFVLEDLMPGTYTISEIDPEHLLEGYEYNPDGSVWSITVEIHEGEDLTETLINRYRKLAEPTTPPVPTTEAPPTPTPTETPTPTPEVTPTPTPEPEEILIEIPVTKIWDDDNNRDGKRPGSVTVHLFADGVEIATVTLSDANNWRHVFKDLPKYAEDGHEIYYSITEDPVEGYETLFDGTTITNRYKPEEKEITIIKYWDDNNNAAGLRPKQIIATLNNGMSVTLNEGNNWSATIRHLPVWVNGEKAYYFWKEIEVLGYQLVSMDVTGDVTTLTNKLFEYPEEPPEGKQVPPTRGTPVIVIEEYGTPLGIEVIINHVGDCFD